MSDESVILINLLKVKPGKQDALIALLKQNTDTVVRTLHGWKTTRLIAAKDGQRVVKIVKSDEGAQRCRQPKQFLSWSTAVGTTIRRGTELRQYLKPTASRL